MASLNQVNLIGRFVRDPELRYTSKGSPIVAGSLAVSDNWTTEAGEKKESVVFVDFTAWGRTAEAVGQYCRKGSEVYVGGKLKLDSWEDKQTHQKRSKLTVTAQTVQFLGKSPAQGEGQPTGKAEPAAAPSGDAQPPLPEDDVPF